MKKMVIKILTGFIIFIILVMLAWWFVSGNTIREYKDAEGNELPESLSEKSIVEINGSPNGLFINSRNTSNPVLLLVSSGPGTDDYFLTERFSEMHIDDLFTLVYWDYRGMGLVYDKNTDPETITGDVLVDDTRAMTEYLMERFNQEKIYIMGFSGGTNIAIRAAHQYPELYYAYIGMAQVVTDSSENDQLMYDFMKSVFEERKDEARLKKLETLVHYEEDGLHCNEWESFVMLLHEAGGGTTYNETEFWGIDVPIILSRCYTIKEKINYIRGLKMYRTTSFERELKGIDYRKSMNEFEIPVYFLSGEFDYNCPQPLVRDYCEMISAPDKKFYLIPDAAHSPLWENQAESYEAMKEILNKTFH